MFGRSVVRLIAGIVSFAAASPAIVLMDYVDDGSSVHTEAIRDGGFENTTGDPEKMATFCQMPNWTNLGTAGDGVEASQNRNDSGVGDPRCAILASSKKNMPRIHAQSLEYVVYEGDRFNASFMWKTLVPKKGWNGKETVHLVLFYTDSNELNAEKEEIHELAMFTSEPGYSEGWKAFTSTDSECVVPAEADGKTLMMKLVLSGATSKWARFAGVDNVFIEVIPALRVSLVGLVQ